MIAALDVGNSKVCCFIARLSANREPQVIGIGQQASRGVHRSAIVDMEAAEHAIRSAVHAAEQMAGETVDQVVISLSAGHPASRSVGVEITIDGQEVADGDLRRALLEGHQAQVTNGNGENGRQLIHSIALGYSIDGNCGIRDPIGMFGHSLGMDLHLVTASSGPIRNLTACVERCHLDIDSFVVSPYASGISVLVEDELELGVTVIDMGGGTTTIAVFLEGEVIYTDQVLIGGSHVSQDIARGLSTPLIQAERMKTLFGHAMAVAADEHALIEVPQVGEDEDGHCQQVPRSLLVGIIQPRLEETFEHVRSRLEASGVDKIAGRRVVLTGGACQMPGMRDLASLILDKQVRTGKPVGVSGLADATSGPAYATCAGLLQFAAMAPAITTASLAAPEPVVPKGLMGQLGHWFRAHF